MTAGTQEEVKHLKEIGKIVATVVLEMKQHARAGMTTLELDELGGTDLKPLRGGVFSEETVSFPRAHLH